MFDEKSGNPVRDNKARNLNRQIRRRTLETLRFQAKNWKRRRVIRRVEGDAYAELVAAVMVDLTAKENDGH